MDSVIRILRSQNHVAVSCVDPQRSRLMYQIHIQHPSKTLSCHEKAIWWRKRWSDPPSPKCPIQFISTAIVQVLFALLSIAISENEIFIMWYVIHLFLGVSLWQHGVDPTSPIENVWIWVNGWFVELLSAFGECNFIMAILRRRSVSSSALTLDIAILSFWFEPLANGLFSILNVDVALDSVIGSLVAALELSNDVLAVS